MGFRTALFTSALFLAFMAQSVLAMTQVLTEANFDEQTKDGVWFVKFYAPWCGHCQKLAPVIDQLSEDSVITEADAHVAKVDCTTERSICERFGVQSYPTLKVVSDGRFFDYAGPRDIATLAKFTVTGHKTALSEKVLSYPEFVAQREMVEREQLEAESTSQVVTLTSTNFDELVKASKDPWIIKFYAPWCGHCKRLAPTWHRLSKALLESGSSTKVAKVDCTVHRRVCSRFGVGGYPTLFYVNDGVVYKYQQSRSLNAFLDFLNGGWEKAEAVGPIADETLLSTIVDTTVEWASENTVLAIIGIILMVAIVVAILVAVLDRFLGDSVEEYRELHNRAPPTPTGAKAKKTEATKPKEE